MSLKPWYVYILECKNGALYTGITNDLEARYRAHCAGKGAKYTRANPPVRIAGYAKLADRIVAAKMEYAIKQLPRDRKLELLCALRAQ